MKSHFKENLALLRKSDSALADRMEAHPWPVEGMTLFAARTGAPTVKGASHDGVVIPLHSEYDPAREAKQFVDARQLRKSDAQLLNGFGLGHIALEIAHRLEPNRWFVCVEAHEGLFRIAMEAVDLAPLLGRPNFRIFVGRDWPLFQNWLKELLVHSQTIRLNSIAYPPCNRFFPEFYNGVTDEVNVAVDRQRVELATVVRRGQDMDRNGIRNLSRVATARPIRELKDIFSGYPAVMVAAGPSLTAALPHLLAARDRIVVVSVDAALKPLLAYGITPDFVASLDMGPTIMKFYTDLPDTRNMTLVFDPDCWHEVPSMYPGPRVSFETGNTVSRWSKSFFGDLGDVNKGTSVAHTCFQLCLNFGCDPVMYVGLDLSYPGEQTHAEGVPVSSKIDPETKKYIMIPGVQGKPVRATQGFKSFATVFEVMISRTTHKVVQTSEVGALIRGAENMPLPAALQAFATRPVPFEKLRDSQVAPPSHFDLEKFKEVSAGALASLERALPITETGLQLVRQLKRLDPGNKLDMPDIQKKFNRARSLEREIWSDEKLAPLFTRVLSKASQELRSLQAELDELEVGNPERARNVISQFETIFTGYQEGVTFFLEELRPVREQMLKEFGTAGD